LLFINYKKEQFSNYEYKFGCPDKLVEKNNKLFLLKNREIIKEFDKMEDYIKYYKFYSSNFLTKGKICEPLNTIKNKHFELSTNAYDKNWGGTDGSMSHRNLEGFSNGSNSSISSIFGKQVALWNPFYKRFIKVNHNSKIKSTGKKDNGILPSKWNKAKFKIINIGKNLVGLWNIESKKFLRTNKKGNLSLSSIRINGDLPKSWNKSKFKVVGDLNEKFSLWNLFHEKFIRMFQSGNIKMGHKKSYNSSTKIGEKFKLSFLEDIELEIPSEENQYKINITKTTENTQENELKGICSEHNSCQKNQFCNKNNKCQKTLLCFEGDNGNSIDLKCPELSNTNKIIKEIAVKYYDFSKETSKFKDCDENLFKIAIDKHLKNYLQNERIIEKGISDSVLGTIINNLDRTKLIYILDFIRDSPNCNDLIKLYNVQNNTTKISESTFNNVPNMSKNMLKNTPKNTTFNLTSTNIKINNDLNKNNLNKKPKKLKKPISAFGYSYINPANWRIPQKRPPVCIGHCKKNKPAPLISKGTPLDALEYTKVGSLLPKFTYIE